MKNLHMRCFEMQLVSRINRILLLEGQLRWATRPIITTRMVRRRGLPPEWATRPTTMVRMARRPVRPPERAGNSGLNVALSGGMPTRSAARCGHRATPLPTPLRSRGSLRRTPLREHLSRGPSRLPTRGRMRNGTDHRASARPKR